MTLGLSKEERSRVVSCVEAVARKVRVGRLELMKAEAEDLQEAIVT